MQSLSGLICAIITFVDKGNPIPSEEFRSPTNAELNNLALGINKKVNLHSCFIVLLNMLPIIIKEEEEKIRMIGKINDAIKAGNSNKIKRCIDGIKKVLSKSSDMAPWIGGSIIERDDYTFRITQVDMPRELDDDSHSFEYSSSSVKSIMSSVETLIMLSKNNTLNMEGLRSMEDFENKCDVIEFLSVSNRPFISEMLRVSLCSVLTVLTLTTAPLKASSR